MKLIAGLGNPGKEYINTRHNIGFCITDALAAKHNAKLKHSLFKKVNKTNLSIPGEEILVIQPLTYMNLSGNCIFKFYKSLKLNLKDILVICDDINLPLGKIRMRASGSAGGHKGLESIINSLGSEDFSRLRIGIKKETAEDLSEYVLSEFAKEEKGAIEEVIDKAIYACETWIKDGIEIAMNKYN